MFRLLSTTAIALVVAVPAWAQSTMTSTTSPKPVLGQEVRTKTGKEIGTVSDVLMGPNNHITGIIVDTHRATPPTGDVAFNWSDVTTNPQDQTLIVNAGPDMLQHTTPGFTTGTVIPKSGEGGGEAGAREKAVRTQEKLETGHTGSTSTAPQ